MDEGIRARLADAARARREQRVFGLVLGAVLLLFACLSWRKHGRAWPYLAGFGSLSALLGAAAPAALAPVLRVWLPLAAAVGKVNTFLLMGLIYYLLVTPCALVSRLLGTDLLDLKLRDRDSYWKTRTSRPSPESYSRQF